MGTLRLHLYLLFFFQILFIFSCETKSEAKSEPLHITRKEEIKSDSILPSPEVVKVSPATSNLVDIQSVDKRIVVDLRYATANNFMGKVLYDTLRKAYLQRDVALRLSSCQTYLEKLNSGYKICVYDALRPRKVQRLMWDALDSIEPAERGKFVSNPSNGSVHNYGAAVDVTILDATGKALDMGAGYDDIRRIAYPSLESEFLQKGLLTESQIANRRLLRKVMRHGGFINIPTEWWHFNAAPRREVKRKYLIVE